MHCGAPFNVQELTEVRRDAPAPTPDARPIHRRHAAFPDIGLSTFDLGPSTRTRLSCADEHHFGGLHQSVGLNACVEPEVFAGIPCDYCGYDLSPDVHRDLGEQPLVANLRYDAEQLVSPADGLNPFRPRGRSCRAGGLLPCGRSLRQQIHLVSWDPMMAARCFDGPYFSSIYPLFQRRVADVHQAGSFRQFQ